MGAPSVALLTEKSGEKRRRPDCDVAGVTRLTRQDAGHTLELLRASRLVQERRVCLVGLDAIRNSMGPRWAVKRETIYEHIQRSLERHMGVHGYCVRINETEFLVAQPSVTCEEGQAACLNCLREVLRHFLGEALPANIALHEVTEISDDTVSGQQLQIGAAGDVVITEHTVPAAQVPLNALSPSQWTPFISGDGLRLRVSCQLEPVFELKTYRRIGFRMARRVLRLPDEAVLSAAEHRRLAGVDIEKIDFATLARGVDRLQQEHSELPLGLILPVSFSTLSSRRGRAALADFFRAAQSYVQRGLICEVCECEGAPSSVLLEATSLFKPYCLFVVARLDNAPQAIPINFRHAGLRGLSIECPAGLEADGDFAAFVKGLIAASATLTKAVMIFGLKSARHAAIAGLVGATHCSFSGDVEPANHPL
jgi:hypothetical protein